MKARNIGEDVCATYEERERVKQDILHVFLRFEKVLSKEHGAYKSFRLALRDALYVF